MVFINQKLGRGEQIVSIFYTLQIASAWKPKKLLLGYCKPK